MKEIAKFTIGSEAFFGCYPDHNPHDHDIMYVMGGWCLPGSAMLTMRKNGKDEFFIRDAGKDELIEETLKCVKLPMKAGKFLVPEYAKYLGMTIDDLKRLDPLFNAMDEKHSYERTIYNFYIENNGFTLTDEQRLAAYKEYKKARRKPRAKRKTKKESEGKGN